MRTTRFAAGVLASVLTLVLAATLAAAPAGANPQSSATGAAPTAPTDPAVAAAVTLLTGDRVSEVAEGRFTIDRGPDRDHITFLSQRSGDQHYVIPSDALALVQAGQLDRRLFDVSLLREFGYDDRRADLPLLLTGTAAAAETALAGGAEVLHPLPAIDAIAARVDKTGLGEFWNQLVADSGDDTDDAAARTLADGLSAVLLDGLRQPLLAESVPQVGAPAAWDVGLDGSGVTVAVLDTGIDATHPDLAARVVGAENFTEGEEDERDLVGHGTHVASIVAGGGEAADGQYVGVAPGAQLLDGKVCVEFGCAESWILAGMHWAAQQGAEVINMSLGGQASPEGDPVEQAVQALTDEYGVLFVVSAGNEGGTGTIGSPATADAALAVGAVTKDDELAGFSSRGPRLDGALKPDLTAPGVDIVAANSADGFLGSPGEAYTTLSGTSMSAPHVAGAAAILRQQHPDWGPEQVKAALMASAQPHPQLSAYAQGAGRLDLARAVTQPVTTSPASVSFQRQPWPHEDNPPETRTVTYHNHREEALTLDLTVSAFDPDGAPAPDGFFTIDADSVTVPAGETAQVAITADTAVGEVDGGYGGRVTATAPDGAMVTTPFAVDREVESYELTLVHTDRSGEPADGAFTTLWRLDEFGIVDLFGSGGPVTRRVPAGEYTLTSFLVVDSDGTALLAQPRLVIDQDSTVEVDGRLAEPVSVSVPRPSAEPALGVVSAEITTEHMLAGVAVLGDGFEGIYSGQIGPAEPAEGFASSVTGTWARPDAAGDFGASPYRYDLAWFAPGEMVTGFQREVAARELARVQANHAVHAPDLLGMKAIYGVLPGVIDSGWSVLFPFELPHSWVEYHNTDGGVQWRKTFEEIEIAADGWPETFSRFDSEPTEYQAGRLHREQWNRAVFGPVLPREPTVYREGDELWLLPQLYGDAAGRAGASLAVAEPMLVYRDGELIAELPEPWAIIEVPPESGEYRVEISVSRDEWFPLSTATELAWTFESGATGEAGPQPLPVSVVRFTPRLDANHTAPAGRPFLVPVTVAGQPGSAATDLATLTVEVSYDDGGTWQPAPLLPGPQGQRAMLWHPRGEGYASLRATAADLDGNTVEQTIIRAYAIG